MLRCPACVAESPGDADECWQCGHRFNGDGGESDSESGQAEASTESAPGESRSVLTPGLALHFSIGCLLVAAILSAHQVIQYALAPHMGTPALYAVLFAFASLITPLGVLLGAVLIRQSELGAKGIGVGLIAYNSAALASSVVTAIRGPGPDRAFSIDLWINLAIGVLGFVGLVLFGYWLISTRCARARSWAAIAAGSLYTISLVWSFVVNLNPEINPEVQGMLVEDKPLELAPFIGLALTLLAVALTAFFADCWATLGFGITLPCCLLIGALAFHSLDLAAALEFLNPIDLLWVLGIVVSLVGIVRAPTAPNQAERR